MNRGEFLTRLSIWLALGAYAAGAGMLLARPNPRRLTCARWMWTCGCALFLAHVAFAFTFYHDWSHAAAYRETAQQTGDLTGWHWGGGLYWNYLFGAAWLASGGGDDAAQLPRARPWDSIAALSTLRLPLLLHGLVPT